MSSTDQKFSREINYQLFSLILVYAYCETEYVRLFCFVTFVLDPCRYDTASDPHEEHELSQKNADVVARMRRDLAKILQSYHQYVGSTFHNKSIPLNPVGILCECVCTERERERWCQLFCFVYWKVCETEYFCPVIFLVDATHPLIFIPTRDGRYEADLNCPKQTFGIDPHVGNVWEPWCWGTCHRGLDSNRQDHCTLFNLSPRGYLEEVWDKYKSLLKKQLCSTSVDVCFAKAWLLV